MENLIFSLNATVPIFLLMVLGLFFQRIGWISESFAMEMNRFVFLIPLPVMVFEDLATVKFEAIWDMKFVLFCFFVTVASIGLVTGISFLWKDKGIQASLYNLLIEAVQPFLVLLLFKIFMEMREWHRL